MIERVVGGCRLEGVLGTGSLATVYLARDARTGAARAVKILDPVHARGWGHRARFWREAELAASLRHPSIVAVERYGFERAPYLVMDLVSGSTLADELASGGHWERPLEAWIGQVAAALDHAHQRGILHRDVKPANVLIGAVDDRAFLGDFGLARVIGAPGLTQTGLAVGNCAYMSPEQCRGSVHELDERSDVYALAAMLFEVATGRVPFGRGERAIAGHLGQPPPAARACNPHLPAGVEEALAIGLAKAPADRHASAGALAADFLSAFGRRSPLRFGPALLVGPETVPLRGSSWVVGRRAAGWSPDVDLSGADGDHRVSRRHATLAREADGIVLRDLGSRNGTQVNGAPAAGPSLLHDDDRVTFAGVETVYLATAPCPPEGDGQ
jgi:serine/threonine protein kinase